MITLEITGPTAEKLRHLAESEKRSEAEIIRDARGEFVLVPFLPADVIRSGELLTTYEDLDIGLADAALAACAERLGIPRLLCLDQRHFRVIRPHNFPAFVLLPADAH